MVPPLRQHLEDLPDLLESYVAQLTQRDALRIENSQSLIKIG